MKRKIYYQYYAEGKNEKKLLETLKRDLKYIESGKIEIFNVIQNTFTSAQIRTLKRETIVVLVYDTDVENTDKLQQNIAFLKAQKAIKEVICIPQVQKLEDELKYACKIGSVMELTHSTTKENFKRDLNRCSNLEKRLKDCDFELSKLWSRMPANEFRKFGNGSEKIKCHNG